MAAAWKWSLGSWRDGPQRAVVTAATMSLKARLLDPSEVTFALSGYGPDGSVLSELVTDVWAWRDAVAVFRGRVTGPTEDSIEGDSYTTHVRAVDYRGVLDRRILYSDRTWTGIEQTTVAWDLIGDTQSLPGGNIGLTKGVWPVTGVTRDVTFKAGDTVWDSLKRLGAMGNGFDVDIDVNLAVNAWWPQRGADNGINLDYGGVVAKVRRTFDPASYANAIRQSGADATTPVVAAVDDISTTVEGRWDAQYGDTQLSTNQMIADTWSANLARASRLLPSWQLTLKPGAWGGPGHVWLGDYVTVVVKVGRLLDVVKARVYELDVDIDAAGQETVAVVVGETRTDPRSVLRGIAKRVAVLAKR